MDTLSHVLPIFIYILLIGLIIIGIIIGIKLIITMNKVEKVIDNIEGKVNSLNGFFNIIEATSGKITSVYDKVISFITGIVEKVFIGRKEREDEDYE